MLRWVARARCIGRHPCFREASRRTSSKIKARAMSETAESPDMRRIAVGQMTSVGDQEANFQACSAMAREARGKGCQMLFLPEVFSYIGASQAESLSKAEPLDGPVMSRYRELARSTGLWLSLGGFQETGPDPEHMCNTHVIVSDAGDMAAAYRKIFLFDVEVPSGPILMESRGTAPGTELVVCAGSPLGPLGLATCYDLRFPEMSQALVHDMGARTLLYPSAFTVPTGAAHWEVLLRARAIESQAFVVAAAQVGRHNDKRESYGHAMVVDPWGRVLLDMGGEGAGIGVVDIDLGEVDRVRSKMPCTAHRNKGKAGVINWPAGGE